MEPRLGGRWLEISDQGAETCVATITTWEPPHRVVMLWQVNAQWKPDPTMRSEVDVRFTADGPDSTVVELLHHKFETMGADAGASMRKDVDGGWRRSTWSNSQRKPGAAAGREERAEGSKTGLPSASRGFENVNFWWVLMRNANARNRTGTPCGTGS